MCAHANGKCMKRNKESTPLLKDRDAAFSSYDALIASTRWVLSSMDASPASSLATLMHTHHLKPADPRLLKLGNALNRRLSPWSLNEHRLHCHFPMQRVSSGISRSIDGIAASGGIDGRSKRWFHPRVRRRKFWGKSQSSLTKPSKEFGMSLRGGRRKIPISNLNWESQKKFNRKASRHTSGARAWAHAYWFKRAHTTTMQTCAWCAVQMQASLAVQTRTCA